MKNNCVNLELVVSLLILLFVAFALAAHADTVPCPSPTPAPAKKYSGARRVQPARSQTQKQDQANEQEQHQIVNVYNNTYPEQPVHKHYHYSSRKNNHLSFLLGWGPVGCCVPNNKDNWIGGIGYERRITGSFWLGAEAFTNRSYFGKVGLDF